MVFCVVLCCVVAFFCHTRNLGRTSRCGTTYPPPTTNHRSPQTQTNATLHGRKEPSLHFRGHFGCMRHARRSPFFFFTACCTTDESLPPFHATERRLEVTQERIIHLLAYLAVHLALVLDDLLDDGLGFLELGPRERLPVAEVEPVCCGFCVPLFVSFVFCTHTHTQPPVFSLLLLPCGGGNK